MTSRNTIHAEQVAKQWEKPVLAKSIAPHLSKNDATMFSKFIELRGFGGNDTDLTDMFLCAAYKPHVFQRIKGVDDVDIDTRVAMLTSLLNASKLKIMRDHFDSDLDTIVQALEDIRDSTSCDAFEWLEYDVDESEHPISCKTSMLELRFKTMLEDKLKVPFTKASPSWLLNRCTGNKMELDMYNRELMVAVEYNGLQHYEYPNDYHLDLRAFIDQVNRDALKVRLCKQNGVKLISIKSSSSIKKEWAQFVDLYNMEQKYDRKPI